MSKIPSRKFSTAKRKIASKKLASTNRKIGSGKPDGSTTAKIPSRKFAKAKKVVKQKPALPAPLDRPTVERSRQEVVATMQSRMDALKGGRKP